jgi:hypothetical protein
MIVASGKITLAGELEAAMARVVPHILREEIRANRFEWALVGAKRKSSISLITTGQTEFRDSLQNLRNIPTNLERWEALASWTSAT